MLISDFDYALPDELIARHPTADRRGSRLLELGNTVNDLGFDNFPDLLRPGDLLVFNDTQVIKARLRGHKETGGRVEILVERLQSDDTVLAHVKASKTPKPGQQLLFADDTSAEVIDRQSDLFELRFSRPIAPFLDAFGEVPLPPYLGREANDDDAIRYQTVYAKDPGAVAAPTAGLHFDQAMLAETQRRGVGHAFVTLHVGAGTFQSLRESDIDNNELHSERVVVSESCCTAFREARQRGGRIIAIGTTAVRALECASTDGELSPFRGETRLFIRPGYRFRSVDAMLTNFHLPQSSLLMLLAAFAGRERVLAAYRHAVREKYRFFSYGDAMFVTPEPSP